MRWDRGAINAMQKDILLLFVARSVTVIFERHKAYEVEREGTKPYRGKAESNGTGPFVGDIESDRTKPQVETGQSIAFISVVVPPFGRYTFCRLPFGISSAPEIFQRKMSTLLKGQDSVEGIMDDILVPGRKREEYDARLSAS